MVKDFAYEILKRLKKKQSHKVLMQLQEGLSVKQLEKGQHHKVLEESFDAKPIYHRQFLIQKITNMHLNPVRGKWKLVEYWEDYEHSSAKFYVKNIEEGFVPMHYEELS